MTRLIPAACLALTMLTLGAPRAEAGPPAICHQFQTGGAPSLPWGAGQGWRQPLGSYDVNRLVDDTLKLLTPTTPVLARMETIRRATIYASTDAKVAGDLLSRLLGRALDGVSSGPANRLALFDAGYLVETYRQASLIHQHMLKGGERDAWTLRETPKLDGYAWIVSALAMGPSDPEMEFGASRVVEGAKSEAHLRRAMDAARAGTPLAATLAAFGYQPRRAASR